MSTELQNRINSLLVHKKKNVLNYKIVPTVILALVLDSFKPIKVSMTNVDQSHETYHFPNVALCLHNEVRLI